MGLTVTPHDVGTGVAKFDLLFGVGEKWDATGGAAGTRTGGSVEAASQLKKARSRASRSASGSASWP